MKFEVIEGGKFLRVPFVFWFVFTVLYGMHMAKHPERFWDPDFWFVYSITYVIAVLMIFFVFWLVRQSHLNGARNKPRIIYR